ncbi:hypothetical protein [Aeromicrobium stalagmiti]|uniref:hypothetical protein n=1 Tax=Aeromicrobium stalagmiti TaxID=2738988 RepID=UPI0015689E0B|nr:hypothetical protein [Aeromicrobium stalagmiti]NRQ50178.1 hypothetical protein [Aeromicrobium stalagmiti]
MKKTLSTAVVVAALALTSACGGGSDRPSKGELADQLEKSSNGAITKKQADCAAAAILDSKLSDEALNALAEGDADYKPSDEDKKVQADMTTAIGKCVTG